MAEVYDEDLAALQETRDLVRRAGEAATEFARMDPARAKEIARRVCDACESRAEHYARWAVEETGIGRAEDKLFKNLLASRDLMEFYRNAPLGGIQPDDARKMLRVGRPAGVVMGLVASTSPIATLYFKVLSCLLTRNAIILSPHPLAHKCSVDAAEYLRTAARAAGAPADAIQIQHRPTLEATHAMMRNPGVNLILATGGGPMVRAAYSSGTPSLGVGPGNVPVYVDATADLDLAVREMVAAKTFDYGSACSTPSVVFVHRKVADAFAVRFQRAGAHYCTPQEQKCLEAFAFPGGHLNTKTVGRSAQWIASQSGLGEQRDWGILVGSLGDITRGTPMAQEKLSPILGLKVVEDRDRAIREASAMLKISGAGHTSGIFCEDIETITLWGASLDVNRTVVNKGTSMGVIGDGTHLAPTFTIGTGFAGRSSIAENVGPEHLINWKLIAFPTAASNRADRRGAHADELAGASAESVDRVQEIVRAVLASTLKQRV